MPAGADAVLMQEQAEAVPGEGLGAVRVRAAPAPGDWIRRRGEDVRAGDVVLARGARLTPQALGLAASVGAATLQVLRRPRVALLSTGDELVMPGEPLKPGAIYNSNRFMLRALLQAAGCECTDLGIVPDRLQATRDALRQAAEGHDLILSSGGVSVGEEDHLKPAVHGRRPARAVADRHQAGQAAGLRRGAARARTATRCSSACPATRCPASSPSCCAWRRCCARCRAPTRRRRPACRCAPTSTGPGPTSAASSCACASTAPAAWTCSPTRARACSTSAVWADGLVDNPPGQAHPARRYGTLPAPVRAGLTMKVHVRYFASLREALGAQQSLDMPAGSTLGALRDALLAAAARAMPKCWHAAGRCAARWTSACATRARALVDGAEVAFFPPVTGG